MLLALRASPASSLKELPKRLLVAKWGANANVKGAPIIVNETTARLLPHVNRALGGDRVALDFEHNTVKGSDEWRETSEPRKVAAMGVPRVVPNEGLFIEDLQWTPEGEASARGGHHPDISPAVKTNDAGEVLYLHSAAVCRQGAVPDLQLFTAALDASQLRTFSAASGGPISTPSSSMDPKKIQLLMLGLGENATDADITAAANTFAAGVKAFAAAAPALANLTTLSATVTKNAEGLTALQKALDDAERGRITAEALAAGKLITASVSELPLESFRKIVAELPAGVVPLEKRTPEAIKTFSVTGVGASPSATVADEVYKQIGVSKDLIAKHSK